MSRHSVSAREVPTFLAIIVAPAVNLSVVGQVDRTSGGGTRHLALNGRAGEVLHPARRLLIFSSTVTLALNVAEPMIAQEYDKATFDAVGP